MEARDSVLRRGCMAIVAGAASVRAQESDEALAKQTANPVASLISVPFQNNYECCIGPEGGDRDISTSSRCFPCR
jgi:hypothetical protein